MRSALLGKPEGKNSFGHAWGYNSETNLNKIGWEGVEWINLAQESEKWWAVVKTVMNLFYAVRGICGLAEEVQASQEELCCVQSCWEGNTVTEHEATVLAVCKGAEPVAPAGFRITVSRTSGS